MLITNAAKNVNKYVKTAPTLYGSVSRYFYMPERRMKFRCGVRPLARCVRAPK
jgi:hypothetical protein